MSNPLNKLIPLRYIPFLLCIFGALFSFATLELNESPWDSRAWRYFFLFGNDNFGEDVALSGWLGHVLLVLIVLVCKRQIR